MAGDDTPMMRQYKEIKEKHKDSVLFFRMGDFYEMFCDDAKEVSRLLNLTLTKRQGLAMAGIPYHAVHNYVRRLLQLGKRVAICEQTELPKKSGRGISKREVVEIVSPGTVLQDNYLDRSSNNYLQAFCRLGQFLGMAMLDFSTGEFVAGSFMAPSDKLRAEVLQRELLLASSRELLLMEELHDEFSSEFWRQGADEGRLCNRIPAWCFAPESAERKLTEFFGVQSLKGFGFDELNPADIDSGAALGAAWVLVEYLQQNQLQAGVLAHVQRLLPLRRKEELQLDSAALRNLEVFQNIQSGARDYTLFQVLHHCQSAMGSRCLHRWLRGPLLQRDLLEQRYERVAALLDDSLLCGNLREDLAQLCDLERVMSRIVTAKANARDLVALRQSIGIYEAMYDKLRQSKNAHRLCDLFWGLDKSLGDEGNPCSSRQSERQLLSEPMAPAGRNVMEREAAADTESRGRQKLGELRKLLLHSVAENPPVVLHEGGMIAAGYSEELDELRRMLSDRRQILDAYVAREQSLTGLSKLKLKYNKIIGYYFEITKNQAAQAKLPEHFIRRQSLVGGERYSTEELAELEAKLSSADGQIVQLERQLFEELRQQLQPYAPLVLQLAQALAELDVLANFAELAQRHNYVRPELLEQDSLISIKGARHPVVEQYLRDENFVPNDLELDEERFFALITGPNMAGKSTYLRQNALIVLLAQIGCYVPAKRARLPIVDRIFCRVGASDNLSRGESTFMVEMQEAARILNEASRQSLVIMDEVGRGTSTRDGLAIAQSICEFILHKLKCLTLFATHYHELTTLCESHLKLLCLAVDESGEKIRFLKHVQEGAIASSYGVHVASLAGIPAEVTARAQEILQQQVWPSNDRNQPIDIGDITPFPQRLDRARRDCGQSRAQELYELCNRLLREAVTEGKGRTAPRAVAEESEGRLFSMLVNAIVDLQQELGGGGAPDIEQFQELEKACTAEESLPSEKGKRSHRAREARLLFSEADLLLNELQALKDKDPGLEQLNAEKALELLRQWSTKYL